MKQLFILTSLMAILFAGCQKAASVETEGRYKARFEIAGDCSNYTFSVIEGNIDPSLVEKTWTDPETGKSYSNAFGILNQCYLKSALKVEDEFYFEIVPPYPQPNCITCEAFYPTPDKKFFIKIVE